MLRIAPLFRAKGQLFRMRNVIRRSGQDGTAIQKWDGAGPGSPFTAYPLPLSQDGIVSVGSTSLLVIAFTLGRSSCCVWPSKEPLSTVLTETLLRPTGTLSLPAKLNCLDPWGGTGSWEQKEEEKKEW